MIVLPLLYGVVGITLGTWWFYRKYLAEPLKLLADATEQIHNQNLDFSISYGRNDEFGQLCESFEKMRQHARPSAKESSALPSFRQPLTAL